MLQQWDMPWNLRDLLLSAKYHNTTSNNTFDYFDYSFNNFNNDNFPDHITDSYRDHTSELHLRGEIVVRPQWNSHRFWRGCNKPAAVCSVSKCQSSLLQNTGDDDTATNNELFDDNDDDDDDNDDDNDDDDDDTRTNATVFRMQQYYSMFYLLDHCAKQQRYRPQIIPDLIGRRCLRVDDPIALSN